jgi:hypothetical protein
MGSCAALEMLVSASFYRQGHAASRAQGGQRFSLPIKCVAQHNEPTSEYEMFGAIPVKSSGFENVWQSVCRVT